MSFALVIAVAMVFAFSAFGDSARPIDFKSCFVFNGRSFAFSEGRVMVDGVDVGRFSYFMGDATKGPDRISVSASPAYFEAMGVDPSRFWHVTSNGIRIPLENGEYQTASQCVAQ